MNKTNEINQPRVIALFVVIGGLILFLVLTPILTKKQKPVKTSPVKGNPTLVNLPENYSDVKQVKPIKIDDTSPLPRIKKPLEPTIPEETISNQKPIATVIVERELTKREKDIIDGNISALSFSGFKPAPKKPQRVDNTMLKVDLKKPGSKYLIQAGTSISALTVTAINSDLPGHVVAMVNRNIYSSIDGEDLLIPQGAKLIGSYSSNIKLNQKRIKILWHEIKLPNGGSISLGEGMQGVGVQGMAGAVGDVDNHYFGNAFSIFTVALLSSSAKQISNSGTNSLTGEVSGDVANDVANAGSGIFKEQVQLGPTITIPIGSSINVLLTQDLIFTEAYNAKTF